MTTEKVSLDYVDSDGAVRTVENCVCLIDKAGRYWLWSDALSSNLAYKIRSKEDCLLAAIDSLLFTIQLRDERIAEQERIVRLATGFANAVRPDEEES